MNLPVRGAENSTLLSREAPERIVLPLRPGATPSDKPPVRIFLGTEPAQYRVERVFLWSIESVRDPGRIYEIYLMKQLIGFDSRRWLTGFTNYRFAIPHFAGGAGRAIYNDVDQLYLADPGELFDLELEDHGYLAVSPRDTSVMVMDCARMIPYWTLESACVLRKNLLIDRALAVPGLYGQLGSGWNARDQEYAAGQSKCVHYTTLHRQPWRPFPERFVYQPNPAGELFEALERETNEAGYNVFGPDRPSRHYVEYQRQQSESGAIVQTIPAAVEQAVSEIVARSSARSLLEFTPGFAPLKGSERFASAGVTTEQQGLMTALDTDTEMEVRDGVIYTRGLEELPTDDLPWVVDELFRHALRFVLVAVRSVPPSRLRGERRPLGTVHKPEWFVTLLENAAVRRPDVRWQLLVATGPRFDDRTTAFYQGGRFFGGTVPRVWVLEDHKPGHSTQSLGLVEELGWPYRRIQLQFNRLAKRSHFRHGGTLRGLTSGCAGELSGPWPDLVVSSGARTMPVAEWIRNRSRGRTRTVYLGRKGAYLGNVFDLSVAPAYAGLYPDARRIETIAPLTRVREDKLRDAAQRWSETLQKAPAPHIALLVGGGDLRHELTPDSARCMGEQVAAMARRVGGSVWVTTSRRTSSRAAEALRQALGDAVAHFHCWSANGNPDENPYMAYLSLADVLVVTGESASMLAEACATGKPVQIYPLRKRTHGFKILVRKVTQGFAHAVRNRAFARPLNRRGWERPQRRLELLCARLVAHGLVRPKNGVELLHETLVEKGFANYFDGTLDLAETPPLQEVQQVAERVRSLMGCAARCPESGPATTGTGPFLASPRRWEVGSVSVQEACEQ